MDASVHAATQLGAWAAIRGYFTPATLFVVLNLVIGTIALTSRSHQRRRREHQLHHHHDYPPQAMQYQDPNHQQQQEYHYYQQPDPYATPPPPQAPLARTSSVLDRLRSIGLYRFRSGDFPPEYGVATVANATHYHDAAFAPVVEEEEAAAKQYARSQPEPTVRKSQAPRVPATRVVHAVAEDDEPSSPRKAEYIVPSYRENEEQEYVPPSAPLRAPPPLSRTSSVLDRLRSLGLYNFLGAADQPAPAPAPASTDDKKPAPAPAHYDRSRSEPAAREQGGKERKAPAAEPKMAKSSSSATRKPRLVAAAAEEDCVDARAEAFIDSFRKEQSLKRVARHVHDDDDDEHHAVPPPPAPLARTSSVLDRLRSFSLYLRSADPVPPEDPVTDNKASTPAADERKKKQAAAAQYERSRSEPAREQGKKKQGAAQQARMSKTSSEANVAEAAAPAEECVDARADDFINKFRQQLQLQRLNSLLSYGGANTKQ